MAYEQQRLSAPEYPRGTEDGDDFDFGGESLKDDASMGGRGSVGGGLGGYGNTGPVNPHFSHMTGVGGDATMAREKEEIDLRGRVLQEQLENRGGMDP